MVLAKELLAVLACPKCKGDVGYDKKAEKIICKKCRLMFSCRDSIPNMLIEDAEKF